MRETGGPGTRWDSLSSGELMTSPQGQVTLESLLSLSPFDVINIDTT